jgi:rubredoxin
MRRHVEEVFCKVCKYGFNKSAPSAQLNLHSTTEYAKPKLKASTVCPESVLPEASVIVPETMIGISILRSSFTSSIAKVLLWHLRYQNSFYQNKSLTTIHKASLLLVRNAQIIKVTALYPGSFTSGDILAVLFVGPLNHTKRGLSGFWL